jgi:hypothetical protein
MFLAITSSTVCANTDNGDSNTKANNGINGQGSRRNAIT